MLMDKRCEVVGTPRDPAWPRNCHATLNRMTSLPHGYHSTIFAAHSVEDAKAMAVKDCGVELSWEKSRRRESIPHAYFSTKVPYKGGSLSYAIWAWK